MTVSDMCSFSLSRPFTSTGICVLPDNQHINYSNSPYMHDTFEKIHASMLKWNDAYLHRWPLVDEYWVHDPLQRKYGCQTQEAFLYERNNTFTSKIPATTDGPADGRLFLTQQSSSHYNDNENVSLLPSLPHIQIHKDAKQ